MKTLWQLLLLVGVLFVAGLVFGRAPPSPPPSNLTSADIDRIACAANPRARECGGGQRGGWDSDHSELGNAGDAVGRARDRLREACRDGGGVLDLTTNRCVGVKE
jgi:hypothetical protein